jgi:hypothetical protein
VTEEVRELADQAQTDVGYDYIWLDDVTYLDWQRYHALLDSELLRLLMYTCCSLVSHLSVEEFHRAGDVDSEWFSSITSH